jgi:hypothetical protein
MARARVIVCEKGNSWAVALRWALAGSGLRVHETRDWIGGCQAIDPGALNLLALELREDNLEHVYQGVVEVRQQFPNAAVIVLMDRALRDHEWDLRELGALHVAISQRNLDPVARLVQRFVKQSPDLQQDPDEFAWNRLPWPEASGR